jgi:hypothetical protein
MAGYRAETLCKLFMYTFLYACFILLVLNRILLERKAYRYLC